VVVVVKELSYQHYGCCILCDYCYCYLPSASLQDIGLNLFF